MKSKDLFQLLHRGYFPKELPPVFNTYTFALHSKDIFKQVLTGWRQKTASPIACSIPKNNIGRRFVHVLNPMKYYFLAEYVVDNYSDVKRICNKSAISCSTPVMSEQLKRRFLIPKSKNVASFQDARISRGMDKYVEMKVDIANFYPSVYTHTIPWAFVGKSHAKGIWKSREAGLPLAVNGAVAALYDKGSQLDSYVECCQDKQTHGIPVGPDVSFLISEAILSHIDSLIARRYPKLAGCRYYDDYYLYFDTKDEAEMVLRIMTEEFNAFGLEVNVSKVEIQQMPVQIMDDFAIKLSNYYTGRPQRGASFRIYFEILWSLVNKRPMQTDTILKYGLRVLGENLPDASNLKEWKVLYMLLFKTAVLAPSIIPVIVEILAKARITPDKAIVKRMTDAILNKHVILGHHVEVLWCLWMCKKYGVDISVRTVVNVFSLENSLCSLMMLDYLNNVNSRLLNDTEVRRCIKRINSLMGKESLYDDKWILLYEGSMKGWLRRMDLVRADDFFDLLRQKGVSFYDPDPDADYTSVSYIYNKPLGVPDYIRNDAKKQSEALLEKIREETIDKKIEEEENKSPWMQRTDRSRIEEKVDDDIEDNDIKSGLFEKLLFSLFSGEEYDEKEIKGEYIKLLMSLGAY